MILLKYFKSLGGRLSNLIALCFLEIHRVCTRMGSDEMRTFVVLKMSLKWAQQNAVKYLADLIVSHLNFLPWFECYGLVHFHVWLTSGKTNCLILLTDKRHDCRSLRIFGEREIFFALFRNIVCSVSINYCGFVSLSPLSNF